MFIRNDLLVNVHNTRQLYAWRQEVDKTEKNKFLNHCPVEGKVGGFHKPP